MFSEMTLKQQVDPEKEFLLDLRRVASPSKQDSADKKKHTKENGNKSRVT